MNKKLLCAILAVFVSLCSGAEECPLDEIWYTTSDGNPIELEIEYKAHTFSDGKGVISFNSNVTSIGHDLFYRQETLTSIKIPASVTSIGECAFFGCTGLTAVTIPTSVNEIGFWAFKGCTNLVSVICLAETTPALLPDAEGASVFGDCSENLEIYVSNSRVREYTLNWGMENQGHIRGVDGACGNGTVWTYKDTSEAKTLTIFGVGDMDDFYVSGKQSDAASNLPWNAERKDLTTVVIENGVTGIGAYSFYYCPNLVSVSLPNSLTSIGTRAFSDSEALETVALPNSVTSIGDYAFGYCKGLKSATIPNSVTSIGDFAFKDCRAMTSVTFAEGSKLARIGNSAFETCTGLGAITIPESVTSIGDAAFAGCTTLSSVTCLAMVPPTLDYWTDEEYYNFLYCPEDLKIYVPLVSFGEYKGAAGWDTYAKNIKIYIPSVKLNSAGFASYSAGFDALILTEGVKAYKAAVSGETITLTELDRYIPAGSGVLLYKENGSGTTVQFDIARGDLVPANMTGNALLPTTDADGYLVAKPATGNVWALSGQQFLHFTGDAFVPNRAYLVTEASVKEMTLEFESETTGISHAETVGHAGNIYNLAGQAVGSNYKGIVIIDGKKCLR